MHCRKSVYMITLVGLLLCSVVFCHTYSIFSVQVDSTPASFMGNTDEVNDLLKGGAGVMQDEVHVRIRM